MCMYICIYIFYTLLAWISCKTRIFKFFKISDPDPDPEFLGSELLDPDPDPTKNAYAYS